MELDGVSQRVSLAKNRRANEFQQLVNLYVFLSFPLRCISPALAHSNPSPQFHKTVNPRPDPAIQPKIVAGMCLL